MDDPDLTWDMTISQESGLEHAHETLDEMWKQHHYLDVSIVAGKAVSAQQFKAQHVWCQWIADALNEAGLDQAAVLAKKSLPTPWTKESVKQNLYKPVLAALSNKDSTKDQDRAEPGKVEQVLARFFVDKFNFILPDWPKDANRN